MRFVDLLDCPKFPTDITLMILKYMMNKSKATKIPNKVITGLIRKDARNNNHSLTKILSPGNPARDMAAITANKPFNLSS